MPSFRTVRFGDLDYRAEDVIHLPDGLLGMPTLNRWLILDMGDDVPLKWFQSLDRADFGFPVTEPFFYHDDYAVEVPDALRRRLGSGASSDLTTLIITTIHAGGEKVTGNLVAPLVVDTETRRGAQLILDADEYSLRQDINYLKFGLAVKSDSSEDVSDAKAAVASDDQVEDAQTREPVEA
jgi:flagellar assembly factor FliW